MFTKKLFTVLLIIVTLITACAPKASLAPADSITLRMGIPDGDNVLYASYVLEFIQQAKTLSNGTITIEPTWEAGDSTSAGYEVGVIQLVKDGKFDLGLAASRSFVSAGITSFEALQAPFLIDNDALAKAVASSDAASRMMENLSSSGLAGLTLWPEDLRHPFSLDSAKPLLSPEDFQGLTIRVTDRGVGEMLMKALGGNPIFEASDYQGAESGLRQGATLTGRPAATGNVTFFAKYQVLFANGVAFEKLNDAQRTILQEAAAAAQKKAFAERPSDVDAGAAWCADGGTIVLASDEQVAAFQKAAQPVFDKLQQNAFNAESIAAIRELKAKTQPSPSAQACASTSGASMQASTEDQIWSEGLFPNGVWQVKLSEDDIVKMGVLKSNAPQWAGTYTWTFQDGKAHLKAEVDITIECDGTYTMVKDFARINYPDGQDCNGQDDIQWRLDADGIHFHLIATSGPFTENKAYLEAKPWQKVEEWSQGLLPNGVWQAELSVEDLVAVGGVMESSVRDNAGVHTFTFQDGNFTWTLQGDSPGSCEGTYSLVGDINRLTATGGCAPEVDDIQWRLDDEGLHLHLVAIENAPFEVIRASLEARPYQKVGDDASSTSTTSTSPETLASNTSWIAFQRRDSSDRVGVWLVQPDGTDEHQILTDIPVEVTYPSWSPDGNRIVVTSRGGETEPLYEYDLAAETSRQLFECKDPCLGDDEPAYSPDGTRVAFIRALLPIVRSDAIGDAVPSDCGLWIGDIATGEAAQVTSNTNPPCDREYIPRWSPDGTQLVYTRDPYEKGKPTGTAVYVINADGRDERQLTDPAMFAGEADWSPDGEWIVFATYPLFEYGDPPGASNLYRIHPDGTGIEQLTFYEIADERATLPRYTPDGKWILFTKVTPEARSLVAIPAEGGDAIVIAQGRGNPNNYTAGAWQP